MTGKMNQRLVRLAIVGATRGVSLAELWFSLKLFRPVAVCDLNRNLAEEKAAVLAREGAEEVRVFTDVDTMLSWGKFDAVLVASSDATHCPIGCKVFDAGFHGFIEKPLALNAAEGHRLVERWQASGKVGMAGHEIRHAAVITAATQKIREGVIGTPRLAITMDACGRMGSYWRRYRSRTSRRPADSTLTLQKGVHHLDIQTYLMGSQARSVFATGAQDHFGGDRPTDLTCDDCKIASDCLYAAGKMQINGLPNAKAAQDRICVYTDDVDLADNQVVAIDYQSGARGSYIQCFFTPDYKVEHTIIGDLGRICVHMVHGNPHHVLEVSWIGSARTERTIYPSVGSHGGADAAMGQVFRQAINDQEPYHPTVADGFAAVALAGAIDRSIQQHQPQPVPAMNPQPGVFSEIR